MMHGFFTTRGFHRATLSAFMLSLLAGVMGVASASPHPQRLITPSAAMLVHLPIQEEGTHPDCALSQILSQCWMSQDKAHMTPTRQIHDSQLFMLQVFVPLITVNAIYAGITLHGHNVSHGMVAIPCPTGGCQAGNTYAVQWSWQKPLGARYHGGGKAYFNLFQRTVNASKAWFIFQN